MNNSKIVDEKIVTPSGVEIDTPTEENPVTSVYLDESGYGYVAVNVTKEQIADYYDAVSSDAAGSMIPLTRSTSTFLGSTDTDETRYDPEYTVDPNDGINADSPQAQISAIKSFKKEDPLLGGIIDVLTELTSTQISLIGGSQEGRELFSDWFQETDIDGLDRMMNREYWESGNVFVTRVLMPMTPRMNNSINKFFRDKEKRARATVKGKSLKDLITKKFGLTRKDHKEIESLAAKKNKWTNKEIPVSYAVLDPLSITISFNEFGTPIALLRISDGVRKIIKETYRALSSKEPELAEKAWRELEIVYGEDYLEDAITDKPYGRVNPDKFRAYFYSRQSYEKYSYPAGGRAINFLLYKKRLRDLALNIISNAIAFVMLIKVGSDKMPVRPEQLRNVEAAWKERPRKKSSAIWFQPHTTEIEIIAPSEDAYNLLKEDIFTQPNAEIAQTFGINPAFFMGVTDSGGQGYSISTIALRPTIARIKTAQKKSESLLYNEMLAIAQTIGMAKEDVPAPVHINTGLENIAEVASAMTQAYDRGAISIKTYLERSFGIAFYDEMIQREWENENSIEDIFIMRGAPTQQAAYDSGRPPGELDNPSTNPNNELKKPKEENRQG